MPAHPKRVAVTKITNCHDKSKDSCSTAVIHSPTIFPTEAFAPHIPIILPLTDCENQLLIIATVVVKIHPCAGPSIAHKIK